MGRVKSSSIDERLAKDVKEYLQLAKPQRFPADIKPMLATLTNDVFESPDWQFEIKWDGYRAIAAKHKKDVILKSRNNKSFIEKFYPVYEAVKGWNVDAVLDGEI